MILEDSPGDVAGLFALERGRLLGLLGTFDESDWHKPSPCPGWTVLGLCCHILGDDLSALARLRDQHHGTIPPEDLSEVAFIEWIDLLQVEWVQVARRLSPRLVIDLLAWTEPQLIELLKAQDPSSPTGHVSWAGQGPVPVWLEQVRELSEYWIHRQQLLQALGQVSDLRADLAEPVLSGLRWAFPYRLNQIQASDGDTVSIEISGPVQATWHVVFEARSWSLSSQTRKALCRERVSQYRPSLAVAHQQPLADRSRNDSGDGRSADRRRSASYSGDHRIAQLTGPMMVPCSPGRSVTPAAPGGSGRCAHRPENFLHLSCWLL